MSVTIRLSSGVEGTDVTEESVPGERIITTPKLSDATLSTTGIDTSYSTITVEIPASTDPSSFAFDLLSLACIVPSLSKDGNATVVIKLPKQLDASSIHTATLLAGLTAISEKTEQSASGVAMRVITSIYKPAQSSTVEKIRVPKSNTTAPGPAVKINIDLDLDDQDDDMLNGDINEDDLLNDTTNSLNGLNAPPAVDMSQRNNKDDCDGRKPCDDCTCGRAEMENSGAGAGAVPERKVVKDLKSNCGNCAKGDAFRCAGCPFLGKPAFKEGEEHLVLDLDDDL